MIEKPDEPFADAPPEILAVFRGQPPTRQQWEAISRPLAPCSVVAGAGSGKTAVMAARVVYLVLVRTGRIAADHPGALPSEILCLTFTNKACEELARRVRDATASLGLDEGEEATVLTYHAFAARLLDDYGPRMGIEPDGMLLSEAHGWQIVASLLADREFEHLEVRTLPTIIRHTLELSGGCADHLREPEEVIARDRALLEALAGKKAHRDVVETAEERIELAELVASYRDRKRALGAIDYGDQIRLACTLAREHPEVASEFRARYPVVLLDEYQDTNIAQARLLQALCGTGYPIFAVGDPDQNIYAWRGASLRNLLKFGDDFGHDGSGLPLYVNFRSGSRILAVADAVIGPVPPERRAPDKVLVPHASRGDGRVLAFVAPDEVAEAQRIASLIKEERAARGRAWADVAVLCRKKRLFRALDQVLREEDVPHEVVDLGGLLMMPEVVEVVAWLRVIEDPGRNVALARLLQGPARRIGYKDLVALARWSMRHNRELSAALPAEDETPGDVAFALAETLDHLDDPDMQGLSDEGRDRLKEFRALLGELRARARGPLADLVADVIERTGLLRELEASPVPAAHTSRANLANFVEFVSQFSPVEGEATLSTLIGWLDVAEDTETELEIAQPSEQDTVKLLTIHKAKGLEWDVVFVPGLAEHPKWANSCIFPDVSRQANPLEQPRQLPFDLRGDADVLPAFDGNLKTFKQALKDRGLEEERRLCYVALTRARDLLVVSSAHWYEGPREPLHPGRFYKEISEHEACEVLEEAPRPETSPLVEARAARAGTWPPEARRDGKDSLFPDGWMAAVVEAVDDPSSVERRADKLGAAARAEFERHVAADLERAARIGERTDAPAAPALPATLSVSGVIDYLRCPKLFYWSYVRPLPRRAGAAAQLGVDIHRWIEAQSRGQGALFEVEEIPDLVLEERLGEPGIAARLRENWKTSRLASMTPLYVERPFLLYVDGAVVGGRIDAIFGAPEGPWEIVDYKTGHVPAEDDPLAGIQLDLYALAAIEVWGKRAEDLTLTYFYVSEGEERSRPAGDPEETRRRIGAALSALAAGEFEASPGEQCVWCDFLSFCDPGRAHVSGR